MLMAVCHSTHAGWAEVEDFEELSDLRKTEGNLLWAESDVENLTHDEIETIAEEFGLHPLAVEDATNKRQRPKLENYDSHLFLILHQLDEVNGQLEAVQLACFVGERFVLTVHHGADRTIEEAKKRWRETDGDFDKGPAHLVHTLLDVIVDCFEEHANKLESQAEELEDQALSSPTTPIQKRLYSVKQQVARLRRYAFPVSGVIEQLTHPEGEGRDFVGVEESIYFRDVQDHTLRINEQVRNVDDIASAVLDLVRGEQASIENVNNRRLAAWAAIFAVSTLVAGVYGMNFRLVPDDGSLFGFWFAVILMAGLSGGLYMYFKRKDWL
jgi:magnesium transporter